MTTNQFLHTIFVKQGNGRYIYISPAGAALFGLVETDFIGQSDVEIFGPEIGYDSLELEQKILDTGQSHESILRFTVCGEEILVKITRHLYQPAGDTEAGIIGTFEYENQPSPRYVGNESRLQPPAEASSSQSPVTYSDTVKLNTRFLNLSTAVAAIATSLNHEHVLETLTWELTNLLEVDKCVVYKWDKAGDCLRQISFYSEGLPEPDQSEAIELIQYPALTRLMKERTPRQYNSKQRLLSSPKNELPETFKKSESVLLLPLVFRENIYGLVEVASSHTEHTFNDQDISLSQLLTDQAAGALTNAWLYEALNEANNSLLASNEELDAFAHTVAHDLKSPLGTIIGFANLLAKDYATMPEAEIQEFLEYIVTNSHKMRSIIEALLTLSSVRRQEVKFTKVEMDLVLAEVKSRLHREIVASNAEIANVTHLPACKGYMPWVEEVWVNYLSNGIKYGGNPPRISIGANLLDDEMVRYWVRDNGRGLSEIDKKKLFIPFSRLGDSDASGTGLGLSIVRRIITRLGGTVGVISEIGEGSEFFFTLPVYRREG